MDPVISVRSLTKSYGKGETQVRALQEVSFQVNKGEFVAIIGRSGSGKSTLLQLLGLLDSPDSGEYLLNGENVTHMKQKLKARYRNREIGFVFQQFHLLARTSALDNVRLPIMYAQKGLHAQAESSLQAVGLGDKLERHPNQLSGGEMQRVAIARALVLDPALVLADEPTGNLDTRSAAGVLDLLKNVHNQGRTILMITHDRDVAECADRILRMEDGRFIDE